MNTCRRCPAPATYVIMSYVLPVRPEEVTLAHHAPDVIDQRAIPRHEMVKPTPYYCRPCAEARVLTNPGLRIVLTGRA